MGRDGQGRVRGARGGGMSSKSLVLRSKSHKESRLHRRPVEKAEKLEI